LIDQFLPGKYDPPAFALKLAHKDVSLANALGRELGVPMRMCNLTLAEMTEALAHGWPWRRKHTNSKRRRWTRPGGSLRLDACELHQFVFLGQPGVLFIDRNKSVNGW
jgi:3-hydroxyisobutyrate dehydrogenase